MLNRNTGNGRARPWKTAIISAVAAITLTAGHTSGVNANESILTPGDSIVTGFSGTVAPDAPVAPNGYFIDLDGSSAQILSLRSLDGPPGGELSVPWSKYQLKAREIGQVFAIALDDGQDEAVPYIYFGATSYFGLEIVVPDPADDGKLKRVKIGHPDAQWMPGQFGEDGDPGAIWRVNGNTGEVTLFAVLPDNSGPGIGDIVFDEEAGQFYVSDLDTGLIYRIDEDGTVVGSFDHGVDGREAAGLAEIEDDGRIADIESSSFNSADPATWGYTQKHRRIAGMAVRGDRLYYAVADGPQVWSVGIADDGRFTGDARLEFDAGMVPGAGPVTDMAFDDAGRLYLAQRGEQRVGGNYSRFAEADRSSVLRFRFVASDDNGTGPRWVKDGHHLAVGADTGHQSNGGIALGYGHDETGGLDTSEPDAMLWTTGDRLAASDDEELLDVHGLQGTELTLLRSVGDPSSNSYFIDYDGLFGDGPRSGPIGDVEIWQPREDVIAELEEEGIIVADEGLSAPEGETWFPPGYAPPPDEPFEDVPYDDVPTEDVPEDSTTTDTVLKTNLKLTKRAVNRNCTLTAVGWKCKFKIRIRNTGSETYVGPIRVSDKLVKPDGATLGFSYSPNWTCWTVGAADYRCRRQVVLPAGASVRLTAVALVPLSFERCRLRNIAEIRRAPGGTRRNTNPSDDKGTAVVKIPSDECTKDPQTGWPGIDPDPIDNPNTPDITEPDPETSIPEVEEDPIPRNTNLKIEKEFTNNDPGGASYHWGTRWLITVTNTGPGSFNGVIKFDEIFPTGAVLVSGSSDLICSGSRCESDGPVSLGADPANGNNKRYTVLLYGSASLARQLKCRITNKVTLVSPAGFPIANTNASDDTAIDVAALPSNFCKWDELTPTRAPEKEDITTSPTPDCKPGYTLTHGECLPRAANCPSGLKKVPASRVVSLRNGGWTVRSVRQNGRVLWCGKQSEKTEKTEHSCRKGWKQVTSKGRVPEGWRSYSVGRGDARIWCVRKADTQVKKCTRPARWNGKTCVCPGHSTWNGKRCVKQKVNSKKAPTQKTTTQKRCKRGYVGHPPNCRKVTNSKRRHLRTKSRRGRN